MAGWAWVKPDRLLNWHNFERTKPKNEILKLNGSLASETTVELRRNERYHGDHQSSNQVHQ